MVSIVISGLRTILALFYKAISGLIVSLYDLIIALSDVNIFNNQVFQNVKNNIFGLIGLFMVFKLAFSVIQYITDPEKLSDSKVGAKQILTHLVIVLIMLGTVNTIFDKAIELQGLILKGAVIEKIIFGTDEVSTRASVENTMNDSESNVSTAQYLSYAIMAPFVSYNFKKEEIWKSDLSIDELKESCNEFLRPIDKSLEDVCENPSPCLQVLQNEDKSGDLVESMCNGLNERDIYKALIDIVGMKINKKFVISIDLFGTVFGLICAIVLLIICVGVSIRAVKLSFLQLISPLPIISYIDPKSGENGLFSKWIKETIKTYLELFIRLIAFYFAVLVIVKVLLVFGDKNGIQSVTGDFTYSFSSSPLVYVFLIIGCFLFALQLPKIVETLFGGSLGGFTRDAKSTAAIAGGVAGIAGGIIGGGISNAVGVAKNISKNNDGRLGLGGVIRSGVAGITGAIGTGGRAVAGTFRGTSVSGEGLKGKSLNPFISGHAIRDAAIKKTGERREAMFTPYTDAKGRVRSSGGFGSWLFTGSHGSGFENAIGDFATTAGVKENTSPVSRINSETKELEAQLRKFQEKRDILSGQMNSAYTGMINARNKKDSLKSKVERDKYKALGGTYNEAKNDYEFDIGGQKFALKDMSYADYESVYRYSLNQITDRVQREEFKSRFHIRNATVFNDVKDKVESEFDNINALSREESMFAQQYATLESDYRVAAANVHDTNDQIDKNRKNVEKIKNANKS